MRLVTFTESGRTRTGLLEGEEVVDLGGTSLPADMLSLLEAGRAALEAAAAAAPSAPRFALAEVRLEAPVPRPPKILAVGLNYADHVAETGRETPKIPLIFNKQTTSVTGPFDPIERPRVSTALDYEGELGFVIGKRCRHVPKARAHEVIAGYTVVDDVSVRDWQMRSPTMTMGKSFDTHCPFGPAIVTADELGDPHGCGLTTFVNREPRQRSNTKELIFDCFDLVEHLSTAFTLEPGDLVSTGTCGGVALAMKPPKWLVPGDVVRVEVEGVGAIENPVIEEPEERRDG
jgi:2-keto-4-pentenoate hydratase/2-oxohepta-3-ene-1,7-dioic acid hydratase in catechol pathway